jgi:hypothetical protein
MACLNTSLLILGLILGSLAVASASRGLLDGGKGEKEDKEKCYPKEYQKECPNGKVEDCFYTESYYDYVKVFKKPCFNDKYYKNYYAISYTDKYGYPACTDGDYDFYAKCDTYVSLYIVDDKYYNKHGKAYLPEECKPKYAYGYYQPSCSICDYNSFKVKCEKKEEEHEGKP